MTDVEVTIEGCDHVMTPQEAIAIAKDLQDLALQALWEDATKPEIVIERGLVTKANVGSVAAEFYPFGSHSWKTNTTRLWNQIINLDEKNWSKYGPRHLKFTVMCFACGVALEQCKQHHYEQIPAVPVNELFDNTQGFSAKTPAVSTLYRRLLECVKALSPS